MKQHPLFRGKKRKFWSWLTSRFRRRDLCARVINIGQLPDGEFPPNYVCNQKYNIITFLPLVLYDQFRLFQNLYFLIMALSQFIRSIRIGYMYTYWVPLGFVLTLTIIREAIDDIRRARRDREVNKQIYERMVLNNETACNICLRQRRFCEHVCYEHVSASALRVGDIVKLSKGQRVPADMILLRSEENMGAVYIRTDQLDGETDWKLRTPLQTTQKLSSNAQLIGITAQVVIEKPERDIHWFIGSCERCNDEFERMDIQNTMWSGCVVAAGQPTGLVVYTGSETRSVMNNETPRSKIGRLDLQVNNLTKVLFFAMMFLSFLLILLKGFTGPWVQYMFRFILLFSYIIPISLRVNLEMSKVYYSWAIQRDKLIEGTVMRSTNIPEELGRIQYLLADKTGTLTKNEMVFKKLQLDRDEIYCSDNFHEIEARLTQYTTQYSTPATPIDAQPTDLWRTTPQQAWEAVVAIALCHNVTPVYGPRRTEDDDSSEMTGSVMSDSCAGAVPQQELCDYQASSPDEVALVKWTDMMGVSLYQRDLHNISLKLRAANQTKQYTILHLFPFTSETKMMGIIVQDEDTGEITYYVKGADVALGKLVNSTWLEDGSRELAAEGLRTLVVAKKCLTLEEYDFFKIKYKEASLAKTDGAEKTVVALSKLHHGLTFLALTGVEDRLADDVPKTLGILRTAGIKVWMLTGDKLETALCIARSLHLGKGDNWTVCGECVNRMHAHAALERLRSTGKVDLVVEGETLERWLQYYLVESLEVLLDCGSVVVARCSPTQKARVVRELRGKGHVVAAVGDGGNDVAMIQDADIGIGIEGLEGKAASLAGDVSVRAFKNVARLLLVHGRRAHMRSSALSLFIVHRGLIVSTMQAVFSVVFYFSSVSLYPGFLMVGYGTIYTILPVFSLVLDKDIPSVMALRHPQLYKQLTKGRQLSYKQFWIWTLISIYQGGVIMYGALALFEDQLIHIVEISYTALILTELIMVALTVVKWHWLMLMAELVSLLMYTATLLIFTTYFDSDFIRHWEFWWKVTAITLVSCAPLYVVKFMHKRWRARQYRNVSR